MKKLIFCLAVLSVVSTGCDKEGGREASYSHPYSFVVENGTDTDITIAISYTHPRIFTIQPDEEKVILNDALPSAFHNTPLDLLSNCLSLPNCWTAITVNSTNYFYFSVDKKHWAFESEVTGKYGDVENGNGLITFKSTYTLTLTDEILSELSKVDDGLIMPFKL